MVEAAATRVVGEEADVLGDWAIRFDETAAFEAVSEKLGKSEDGAAGCEEVVATQLGDEPEVPEGWVVGNIEAVAMGVVGEELEGLDD